MNRKKFLAPLMMIVALGVLSGCDDHHRCDFCEDEDPSGIYEGSLVDDVTNQSTPAVAVIDENGDGRLSTEDGHYYRLGVGTDGVSLYGSFELFSASGATAVSGSVSGEVTQPGLSVHFNPQTGDGTDATLNFDNSYDTPSSLPTLAGSWSYSSSSFSISLSIESTGAFTGSDSNGCTYSGTFNLVDINFNAYVETFVQTCGSITDNFSGQAYYVPASGSGSNAMPAMINILADDNASKFISVQVQ